MSEGRSILREHFKVISAEKFRFFTRRNRSVSVEMVGLCRLELQTSTVSRFLSRGR